MISRKKFITNLLAGPVGLNLSSGFNKSFLNTFSNLYKPQLSSINVDIYLRTAINFNELKQGYNKRINNNPFAIAIPKNENGIKEALEFAYKKNISVSIKSGGHCMEGFSCNDNSLVIDLKAFNKIIEVGKNFINLQPKVLLNELYQNILPKKRFIPGGSCGTVAVAGLTLGGGYGLASRNFGLTCDSLVSAKLIDCNGKIHNAEKGSELLWALKGGGNGNFGIVTELNYKTHIAPKTMQNWRFRSNGIDLVKMITLLKKWFEYTAHLPNYCFSAIVLNSKSSYILLTSTNENTSEINEIVKALTAANETVVHTKPQPLQTALKNYYGRKGPLYFKNASAGLYMNFDDIEHFITNVLEVLRKSPGMIFQVNTLGGKVQDKAAELASSFPHRKYNYFSELQAYWDVPNQEKKLVENFEKIQQIFFNAKVNNHYRNYPDINFSSPNKAYFAHNLDRLVQIKRKYDPNNVFSYAQSLI